MRPEDTIWVRGVIEAPDDDEYPDCVHVAFDESGCSIYLDRREQFVPVYRVLDDADVAAIAALRELDRAQMALSAANTVEGITAAASLVYRTYRAITDDDRARIDRFLGAQP